MKSACARCGSALEPGEAARRGQPVVSQGLCAQCSHHLLEERGVPLVEYLDGLGAPVAVVDAQVILRAANRQLRELVHQDLSSIEGKRGGDVFECAYARLPEGCGQTVHCSACAIRRAVTETYRTGVSQERVPASLREGASGKARPVELLISTERVGNHVLLRVDSLDGRPLIE